MVKRGTDGTGAKEERKKGWRKKKRRHVVSLRPCLHLPFTSNPIFALPLWPYLRELPASLLLDVLLAMLPLRVASLEPLLARP